MKMPQLRILATSFCGRKCLYCRPTGEGGASCASNKFINIDDAIRICQLYKNKGGSEVKVTGGDPVFWPELVTFVLRLKNEVGISKIEVITRSPKIVRIIDDLVAVGLDVLNFSLDTIDGEAYEKITGCNDYETLIAAIRYCAELIPIKINSVIMKGINDSSVSGLIAFCESLNVKHLKLLDIIDDLQEVDTGNSDRLHIIGVERLRDLYVSLSPICEGIKSYAVEEQIAYQGGLGHPMNEYKLASGLIITAKNSENGAWYGKPCESCPSYPCHDALMALRLTSDNRLQFCLLNDDTTVDLEGLTPAETETVFLDSFGVYENAHFVC